MIDWNTVKQTEGGLMKRNEFLDRNLLYLFNKGEDLKSYLRMGAHKISFDGVEGYNFLLWVPNVTAVYLVGDFNGWSQETPMEAIPENEMWTVFVPGLPNESVYKYLIITKDGKKLYKADPYAFYAEAKPHTASKTFDLEYKWKDDNWGNDINHFNNPMNIYEMHLGSWMRHEDGSVLTYRELAEVLPKYLTEMNYTHVGFLPVMEHPYDGSWGYQLTGYYAPTSRFGKPTDFKYLINKLHLEGISVMLDWVPGHFCKDEHGLGRFNGEMLYESGEQLEWGTYKFDYGKEEVAGFLLSNLVYWVEEYHVDGFRVDGISSMIYLNYGMNKNNEQKQNKNGGEGDLIAVEFLQRINEIIARNYPYIYMIAEESTSWPLVTYPPDKGGLGFHYKWNMGWMHDTLDYFELNYEDRKKRHDLLTFSSVYQYSENYILPLSHDEVVHGKFSLIGRMPGDYWQQFANLRILYLYQIAHSGAKLNFMGNEIAHFVEWRYYEELQWFLLDYPAHKKHQNFVKVLNQLYIKEHSLWEQNFVEDGFMWIEADDSEQGVLVFLRRAKNPKDFTIMAINFQPNYYEEFDIGVPEAGTYVEIFNSDDIAYGGRGNVNSSPIKSNGKSKQYQNDSITIKLPPLAGVVLKKGEE